MTCRDFGTISFSEEVKPGSPEHLLLAFKSAKSTYARIFECLIRLVLAELYCLLKFCYRTDYGQVAQINK